MQLPFTVNMQRWWGGGDEKQLPHQEGGGVVGVEGWILCQTPHHLFLKSLDANRIYYFA